VTQALIADDVAHPEPRAALRVWTRIALLSFGGPAGQIAVMQRILVDELRWVSQSRFLHALNFCMLLPGPEAQQLATYIGWLLHRWRGALAAGLIFVLPGFVSILVLSIVYALHKDSSIVSGIFYGIKPAVLAIVVHALVRIARRSLRTRASVFIAAAAFIAIFALAVPFPLIIVCAAVTGLILQKLMPASVGSSAGAEGDRYVLDDVANVDKPDLRRTAATAALWLVLWWTPVFIAIAVLGRGHILAEQAVFFSKAAIVTFGGAYSVLSYVAQQAVEVHHWLQPGEMLDGLGMAETTPGPLIQVVQFVAFMGAYRSPAPFSPLTAALLAAVLATWVTYAPSFLWVLSGAPHMEALRGRASLTAALTGISAAVVGVILNLSVWFSVHTLFRDTYELARGPFRVELPVVATIEPGAALIAALAAVLIFALKRGILTTIGVAALAGLLWQAASS
jgi:chromate transporter